MSSRPILNVSGEKLGRLKMALALADDGTGEGYDPKFYNACKVIGYANSMGRLVFFKHPCDHLTLFPTPITLERAAEIAFDWLAQQKYGPEPDHDGNNHKGWRVFRDAWGHIDGCGYQSFVAVEPLWMEYGK
jgi:hypothetical protein